MQKKVVGWLVCFECRDGHQTAPSSHQVGRQASTTKWRTLENCSRIRISNTQGLHLAPSPLSLATHLPPTSPRPLRRRAYRSPVESKARSSCPPGRQTGTSAFLLTSSSSQQIAGRAMITQPHEFLPPPHNSTVESNVSHMHPTQI